MDELLIEHSLPLATLNAIAQQERNNHVNSISTFHVWWSRKPVTVSRAILSASVLPLNTLALANSLLQDTRKYENFIQAVSRHTNSMSKKTKTHEYQNHIQKIIKKRKLKILDPFAGGGSIPFSALTLGFKTYAFDYNPVATLLLKALLELPFTCPTQVNQSLNERVIQVNGAFGSNNIKLTYNLIEDLKFFAEWVKVEVLAELKQFYDLTENENNAQLQGYIWSYYITCPNKSCSLEYPLLKHFWLAKTKKRKIYFIPRISQNRLELPIKESFDDEIKNFDPSCGTIRRGVATCPQCGYSIPPQELKRMFQQKKYKEKLIASIYRSHAKKGKIYKMASEKDLTTYHKAQTYLRHKIKTLENIFPFPPLPSEEIVNKDVHPITKYGFHKWADLFNERQKLALITFIEKIRRLKDLLLKENISQSYINALIVYLMLQVDRLADFNSRFSFLKVEGARGIVHTFGFQAIGMVWGYMELNPFNTYAGGWDIATKKTINWLKQIVHASTEQGIVIQASATSIPYPDDFFDIIFTDPPYYNNINYADLSDFFYVWLKRGLYDVYPELFSTPLTPKTKEIVAKKTKDSASSSECTHNTFREKLTTALKEIFRVLKPGGTLILVYSHSSIAGWKDLVQNLLESNFIITAAWPIQTELKSRLTKQKTAALSTSLYLIARKEKKKTVGLLTQIKIDLSSELQRYFQRNPDGVLNLDSFIAAIGIALRHFTRYNRIIDANGREIPPTKLLYLVSEMVTNTIFRIFFRETTSKYLDPPTRFYLMFQLLYPNKGISFDETKNIAQLCHTDFKILHHYNLITKKGKYFYLTPLTTLGSKKYSNDNVLPFIVKLVTLLNKDAKKRGIIDNTKALSDIERETLHICAQILSKTIPDGSIEKQRLKHFAEKFRQTRLY